VGGEEEKIGGRKFILQQGGKGEKPFDPQFNPRQGRRGGKKREVMPFYSFDPQRKRGRKKKEKKGKANEVHREKWRKGILGFWAGGKGKGKRRALNAILQTGGRKGGVKRKREGNNNFSIPSPRGGGGVSGVCSVKWKGKGERRQEH